MYPSVYSFSPNPIALALSIPEDGAVLQAVKMAGKHIMRAVQFDSYGGGAAGLKVIYLSFFLSSGFLIFGF